MGEPRINFKEFQNNPINLKERNAKSYSDEFVFRKAMIYENLGPENDKLKVQVMPELNDIDESEFENLPEYPPFIKGQVIVGLDYVTHGDGAEYVWVLCTPDLQVGFIVGKANVFGEINESFEKSYDFNSIRKFLGERTALPEDFDYQHITVDKWVSTDQGGMIQCHNYLTGDLVMLNTSGSIITIQQQKIYMRVGTPPEPVTAGGVAFSEIKMTADKLYLHAPNIEFDYEDLILGKHGLSLTGVLGSMPSGADLSRNPSIPCREIHV